MSLSSSGRWDNIGRYWQDVAPAGPVLPAAASPVATVDEPEPESTLELPPGLLGQLAAYFYKSSIRPVPEVATAAALALTAGITGRQFNVSGTGLNLYLMVTARTGRGKSGLEDGIDRIVSVVRPEIPLVDRFLGPGAIASGQAIHRHLIEHPSIVCILGEFGLTLQQLCHARASEVQLGLKKTLLHLHGKSGQHKLLRPGIYANAENNIAPVESPALTIACEGTPETFYEPLTPALVTQGLVSRFLVLDYAGDRPRRNSAPVSPTDDMVVAFKGLVHSTLAMEQANRVMDVQYAADALALLDRFDNECDDHINRPGVVEAELYNRAHLHALKLAALAAVGCSHHNPVITSEHARWAVGLVRRSVRTVLRRFERGEVGGSSQAKAEAAIRKKVEEFVTLTPEQRAAPRYGIPLSMRTGQFIPRNYFNKRLRDVQPFTGDGFSLLGKALAEMVKADVLRLLDKHMAHSKFKTTGEVYTLGPNWK